MYVLLHGYIQIDKKYNKYRISDNTGKGRNVHSKTEHIFRKIKMFLYKANLLEKRVILE